MRDLHRVILKMVDFSFTMGYRVGKRKMPFQSSKKMVLDIFNKMFDRINSGSAFRFSTPKLPFGEKEGTEG